MSRQNYIFTSESVSEGHPDKLCDRISDAVLDAFLGEEPEARVACETFATTNRVVIGGEVGFCPQRRNSPVYAEIEDRARCIKDIGYEQDKFHHEHLQVTNLLHEQSAHIAQGCDASGTKTKAPVIRGSCLVMRPTRPSIDAGTDPVCPRHSAPLGRGAQRRHRAQPAPDAKSQLSVIMKMASR